MTAKQWLRRGWKLDREIDALQSARDDTYRRILAVTRRIDDTPVSGTAPMHKNDRLLEMDQYIDERVDELVGVKNEIMSAIESIGDSTYRTVLLLRYTRFLTWDQIADELHYSREHVCRLHGRALEAFKDVII